MKMKFCQKNDNPDCAYKQGKSNIWMVCRRLIYVSKTKVLSVCIQNVLKLISNSCLHNTSVYLFCIQIEKVKSTAKRPWSKQSADATCGTRTRVVGARGKIGASRPLNHYVERDRFPQIKIRSQQSSTIYSTA